MLFDFSSFMLGCFAIALCMSMNLHVYTPDFCPLILHMVPECDYNAYSENFGLGWLGYSST